MNVGAILERLQDLESRVGRLERAPPRFVRFHQRGLGGSGEISISIDAAEVRCVRSGLTPQWATKIHLRDGVVIEVIESESEVMAAIRAAHKRPLPEEE